MLTLRKLLSMTLMPDEPDAEDGTPGRKGMEYEYLGNWDGPRHYNITFRHVNRKKKDLVLSDIMMGQTKRPSAEEVFEIVYYDLRMWFDAQANYPEIKGVRAYIQYCIDEFGEDQYRWSYRESAKKMQGIVNSLKRFFGEDWEALGQVDFRSHAFHWKPEERHEMPVATWDYRDPDAEEWHQVRAYIWYKFANTQEPDFAVTGYSATIDDPEGGGGGATWFPEADWRPEQRREMEILYRWHNCGVLTGASGAWFKNTLYWAFDNNHTGEINVKNAMRCFYWGNLEGEDPEDEVGFWKALWEMRTGDIEVGSTEASRQHDRKQKLFEAMWKDILAFAAPQFRPRLELFYDYIKADRYHDFFTEKKHLLKDEDEYGNRH